MADIEWEMENVVEDKAIKVLVVEDNPGDARLVREFLREVPMVRFELVYATTLQDALTNLAAGGTDVVLLDLSLPDSHGLATFQKTREARPDIPIVVFTALNDQAFAVRAIRSGAKDYLIKGQVNGAWLARALQRATESARTAVRLS